jgi:pre-mRNA-splicing factor SYF1
MAKSGTALLSEGLISSDDIAYEEDVLRNPYSMRSWLRYLAWKRAATPKVRNIIYERALHELPGSYKLWKLYLDERRARHKALRLPVQHPLAEALIRAYERALVFLHKMPRIWLDYTAFLGSQDYVSKTRRTFDRALRALPVSQHDRIWPHYLKFIRASGSPESAVRVYRRYLRLEPTKIEEYIEYLLGAKVSVGCLLPC